MINMVFIKEEYFRKNSSFKEMLDPFDLTKQTQRQYLYINFQYKNNNILIPLRKNLPGVNSKLYYPVPSETKPNAGLDYRKILIINNSTYIEIPTEQKLTQAQSKIIINNYDTIEKAVINYIDGYIKAANKNREYLEYDYKFSTLHNFHTELLITKIKSKDEVTKVKSEIKKSSDEVAPTKEVRLSNCNIF